MSESEAGEVWVGTRKGLARRVGTQFVPMWPERFGAGPIQLVAATSRGLVIGAGPALHALGDDSAPEPVLVVERPPGSELTDAALGPDGTLWVTTLSGVLRIEDGEAQQVTRHQGLPSDTVYRVLVDREGDLWFGTDGAAAKLAPSPFQIFNDRDGLPHPFVRALAEDGDGRLWVGTRQGIAVRERGVLHPLPSSPAALEGKIYALAPAAGGILVGTDHGLVLWDNGSRRIWREADGLPSSRVWSLLPDGDGAVWIGTGGGLARLEHGRLRTFPRQPLLNRPDVLALELDGRGGLWIGLRSGGLLHFDGDRVARFGAAEGLSVQAVLDIDRDPLGTLWVGTNGDGLIRLDPGGREAPEVTRFTTGEGLADDSVWAILSAGDGSVWLSTGHGLDRFDGTRFHHHAAGNGLVDLEGVTGAALETADGDSWFGTCLGLVRLARGEPEANRVAPAVVVEEVEAGNAGLLLPGDEIPFARRPLTFHFAALSFRREAAVRHRYRLLGLSDEWSEPSAQRSVSFARLDPGRYVFEVEGSNDDGVWSGGAASFPFVVRPAAWQTWWFRLLVAVALATALALLVRLRLRALETDRRRREAQVAESTAELKRTAARLADLATTDELTRVYNRRRFMELLDLELKRLSREPAECTLSLLLLDVDHFKRINDRHGHPAGDEVLRLLAGRLVGAVRATDLVARYGGEEFTILLPATDLEGAALAARKVQATISGTAFDLGTHSIPVSVSIGVAGARWRGGSFEDATSGLIQRADAALYTAKRRGRDRVVVEKAGRFEESVLGREAPGRPPRLVRAAS